MQGVLNLHITYVTQTYAHAYTNRNQSQRRRVRARHTSAVCIPCCLSNPSGMKMLQPGHGLTYYTYCIYGLYYAHHINHTRSFSSNWRRRWRRRHGGASASSASTVRVAFAAADKTFSCYKHSHTTIERSCVLLMPVRRWRTYFLRIRFSVFWVPICVSVCVMARGGGIVHLFVWHTL